MAASVVGPLTDRCFSESFAFLFLHFISFLQKSCEVDHDGLKGRVGERVRERWTNFILLFRPQVVAAVGPQPSQSQVPGTPSRFPLWVAPRTSSIASKAH